LANALFTYCALDLVGQVAVVLRQLGEYLALHLVGREFAYHLTLRRVFEELFEMGYHVLHQQFLTPEL
jgi:hypothetical protein